MAATRRDLYLSVGGDVAGLTTAMKAGRTALLSLGSGAIDMQAEVDKALADMGAGAPSSAKQIEKAYTATFNTIRANAKAVLNAPSSGAALQVLDAGAAEQAAAAAETQAAALRQVATAAAAVAARGGEAAEAERVLAVAAAANAAQAEQEAVALRNQANVLANVRGELTTMGVVQAKQTVVNGQAKAGYQQLSFQLGDIATQYASGASASLIFAQQSGQVVQAISLIAGESKGLIGLLAGPWGIAFSSALVVATPMVAKLFEESEAAKEARKATEEHTKAVVELGKVKRAELQTSQDKLRADFVEIESEREKALEIRKTTAAYLDQAKARLVAAQQVSYGAGGGAGASGAVSFYLGQVQELEGMQKANETAISRLTTDADAAAKVFQKSIVDANRTPEGRINRRYDRERADAARELSGAAYTRKIYELNAAQDAEIKSLRESTRARDSSRNNQIGRSIDVAEATQIAASIGGRVTSGYRSTEEQARIYADKLAGRHAGPVAKPGTSDHERGQAIDIAYGPGITVGKIKEAFAREGVAIRQLLDERDQKVFHVAFGPKGKSQETIDRQADATEQKRIRDEEAYAQLKGAAEQDLVDATRRRATGIEEVAKLATDDIAIELERRNSAAQAGVAEKKWSQAKADELILLNISVAAQKAAQVQEQKSRALAERELEIQRDDIQGQIGLLELQGDLATNAKDRRAIAIEILKLQEREARAVLQRAIEAEKDPEKKADLQRQLGRVGPSFELRREQVDQNNKGPLDRFRQQVHDDTDDMSAALEGVAVHGVQSLEDGLLGLIDGTESVGSAFKKMANAIIADLARIAIEKAIVKAIGTSFLGFADGGLVTPQAHATGGYISGPGTGTSDDILSWLSNGEFVVTAKATRKYLPVLRAMNDNRLPAFATGGMVGSLPSLPSVSRAANDVYSSQRGRLAVDVSAKVEASPLLLATVQETAVRTVSAAAEPIMAGATSRTVKQLQRPSLPGGWG